MRFHRIVKTARDIPSPEYPSRSEPVFPVLHSSVQVIPPPAASLAAVADRYVDVSDPGFHAAKIRRIFLCRKGTGDFVLRILRFSGPFPPERRCGTLLARSDVYAVGPRTIPALFALRTDRLAGRNGLPLPDALPERTARGGDHLCPAARADARAGRTVPVAAQCGGRIADRRGCVLFPRPHCPAGLDGSEQGPGRRARSAGARGLRAPRGRTRPRPYGLRPLAGEQPAIAFGRNPETRAAARRRPGLVRRQSDRAALRTLFHARRRPPHGGLLPGAAALQPQRRPATPCTKSA